MEQLPTGPPAGFRSNPQDYNLKVLSVLTALCGGLAIVFALLTVTIMQGQYSRINHQFGDSSGFPAYDQMITLQREGMAIFWAVGACGLLLLVSAVALRLRIWRPLIIAAAAVACLWMPLGTALGVFTLIEMFRPSTRALFVGLPTGTPPTP